MSRLLPFLVCLLLVRISPSAAQSDMNPARAGKPVPPALRDGIYLSWQQARHNTPDLLPEDLFKSYYDSAFTVFQWAHTEKLYYIDPLRGKTSLSRDSLWGFSDGGTTYICTNGLFHRLTTFGSICVFWESARPEEEPLRLVVTEKQGRGRERVYDFETGRAGDFDLDNVASLLVRDSDLFAEFDALPNRREKRRQLYRFIERYNERNPAFPAN